jgi:hypothetical protein
MHDDVHPSAYVSEYERTAFPLAVTTTPESR